MKETRAIKKLSKLRYKADRFHAKAEMLTHKGKYKKAGKFEGKAQHFEMKIRKLCDRLKLLSKRLQYQEEQFRKDGNPLKADKLNMRVYRIQQKIKEFLKLPDLPPTQQGSIKEVYKEKEIIKEIVRIPCKYCGTYIDHTETKCPSCGANLEL